MLKDGIFLYYAAIIPLDQNVFEAIGFEDKWALGFLRVTVGRQTSQEDINTFLQVLPEHYKIAERTCVIKEPLPLQ